MTLSRPVENNKEDTEKETDSDKELLKPGLRKKKPELSEEYVDLRDDKDKDEAEGEGEGSLEVIKETYYDLKSEGEGENDADSDFLAYIESVTAKFGPLDAHNSSLRDESPTPGPKSVHLTVSGKGPSEILEKEK